MPSPPDRLERMLAAQRQLQELINGYTLESQNDALRIANVKENYVALVKELGEVLDEVGWKSWATSRHINYDAARREIVDCWHFLMNLMLHFDMTADDLYDGYVAKRAINVQRQTEGYDGVSTKCPHCGRALDDCGVERARRGGDGRVVYLCADCHGALDSTFAVRYVAVDQLPTSD